MSYTLAHVHFSFYSDGVSVLRPSSRSTTTVTGTEISYRPHPDDTCDDDQTVTLHHWCGEQQYRDLKTLKKGSDRRKTLLQILQTFTANIF